MTRARIADGLELLTLQLANGETSLPEGWEAHEWAYIKGLAGGAIMTWRSRLLVVGQN